MKNNLNNKLSKIITETIHQYFSSNVEIIKENDRHKEGYYDEYAERTRKKDRHSPDYYRKYRERKKLEKQKSKSNDNQKTSEPSKPKKIRDRREYYRKYNKEHPERLNRGFTKGYVNGNISDGTEQNTDFLGRRIVGYDEFGMPITNDAFGDMIRNHEMTWHDDDWEESPD